MDLYEYQARDLFEKYEVPVLAGIIADTPEEAKAAAEKLGGVVVVKAQVKTGGRGKAGGVKVAIDPQTGVDEAKAREIVAATRFPAEVAEQAVEVVQSLWKVFVAEAPPPMSRKLAGLTLPWFSPA